MELIGSILILLGAIFLFSAGLGMLRMPDVFTRLQAGTKASTLGNLLVLAGIAFYHPGWGLKLLPWRRHHSVHDLCLGEDALHRRGDGARRPPLGDGDEHR